MKTKKGPVIMALTLYNHLIVKNSDLVEFKHSVINVLQTNPFHFIEEYFQRNFDTFQNEDIFWQWNVKCILFRRIHFVSSCNLLCFSNCYYLYYFSQYKRISHTIQSTGNREFIYLFIISTWGYNNFRQLSLFLILSLDWRRQTEQIVLCFVLTITGTRKTLKRKNYQY